MAPPVTMHAKSDSEVPSLDASSPPRSPRRPVYYVQSPSQVDGEKMSYGSSPLGSPQHHQFQYPHYHCSPVHHHSRESSTSRFSLPLKNPRSSSASVQWKKLQTRPEADDSDPAEDTQYGPSSVKFYVLCFVCSFVLLFTAFSLILWAASLPYHPKITVESIVFESVNLQAGLDRTGVPTDMLSMNSTVKMLYRNPATFFGVHVTATPLQLYYYQLKIASGEMKYFYEPRKSKRTVKVRVESSQVAVYGGLAQLVSGNDDDAKTMVVPLNLTFVMRSRAFVLGRLVKPKFYTSIRCPLTLRGSQLGKPNKLTHSCSYDY